MTESCDMEWLDYTLQFITDLHITEMTDAHIEVDSLVDISPSYYFILPSGLTRLGHATLLTILTGLIDVCRLVISTVSPKFSNFFLAHRGKSVHRRPVFVVNW